MPASQLRRRRDPVARRHDPPVEQCPPIPREGSSAVASLAGLLPCLNENSRTVGHVDAA